MVSLQGYNYPNTLFFLRSLHSSISAASCGNTRDELTALIEECESMSGRFVQDYLALLLQVVEKCDALVGFLLDEGEEFERYQGIMAQLHVGNDELLNAIRAIRVLRFIKGDGVQVQSYWEHANGTCTEATSRKVIKDVLSRCKATSLALANNQNGEPLIFLAYSGSTRASEEGTSRECFALDIGKIFDAQFMAGAAAEILVGSRRLLAAVLDLNAFACTHDLAFIEGTLGYTEDRKKSGDEPKIRTTEELKYPIGLFG